SECGYMVRRLRANGVLLNHDDLPSGNIAPWLVSFPDDDGVTVVRSSFSRVKEGIERFFITDINNPASGAQAQSTIPVMWDAWMQSISTFTVWEGGADNGVA